MGVCGYVSMIISKKVVFYVILNWQVCLRTMEVKYVMLRMDGSIFRRQYQHVSQLGSFKVV